MKKRCSFRIQRVLDEIAEVQKRPRDYRSRNLHRQRSGCENPFVPVTSGNDGLGKFQPLTTLNEQRAGSSIPESPYDLECTPGKQDFLGSSSLAATHGPVLREHNDETPEEIYEVEEQTITRLPEYSLRSNTRLECIGDPAVEESRPFLDVPRIEGRKPLFNLEKPVLPVFGARSFSIVPGGVEDCPGLRSGNRRSLQPIKHLSADPEGPGCCAMLLAMFSLLLIIATMPISLCMCIKVVQEYERAVIFRLGRLRKGGAKGPGIFFVLPCIDSYKKVDLRTVSFDVPPQEVLSRDSVTVTVDAVVYYRVSNPTMATNNVEDYSHSTHLLGATTLRNVLGTKCLAEILSEREQIAHWMETTLDEATDPWGVKVERVEIKDVRLPVQLQRAMAAEAEAAREARAKVIAAEGEQKASRALKEASDIISESSSALQLRYLQTLNSISAEKNSTIIFPVPMDFLGHLMSKSK